MIHNNIIVFLLLFQVQYLERAEKLKTYLNGKKKKPVKAGESSSSDSKKGGADKVEKNLTTPVLLIIKLNRILILSFMKNTNFGIFYFKVCLF